jgi:hypothetical protein
MHDFIHIRLGYELEVCISVIPRKDLKYAAKSQERARGSVYFAVPWGGGFSWEE